MERQAAADQCQIGIPRTFKFRLAKWRGVRGDEDKLRFSSAQTLEACFVAHGNSTRLDDKGKALAQGVASFVLCASHLVE
jgi:hypothetical protein